MEGPSTSKFTRIALGFSLILSAGLFCNAGIAQTLDSVSPSMQRVHDFIELTGSDFGTTQGNSQVVFSNGVQTWNGGRAYLWRDNYIKIRVPVGKLDSGSIVPISKNALQVYVQTASGISDSLSFQVVTASSGARRYLCGVRLAKFKFCKNERCRSR